jgi:hypothetical protein
VKHHAENPSQIPSRSFGDKLDDPQNDPNEYFTVHPAFIHTREFSSKKKIVKNREKHIVSSKDRADKERY